jgi:two-component system sensor histidine kinase YesM
VVKANKRRMIFQKKILFSYLFLALIFVIFVLMFWTYRLVKEQREEEIRRLFQLNEQAVRIVEDLMQDINIVMYMHIPNEAMRTVLSKEYCQGMQEYDNDRRTMQLIIDSIVRQNACIAAVTYVGLNGENYSNCNSDTYNVGSLDEFVKGAMIMDGNYYTRSVYPGVINGNRTILYSISKGIIDINTGKTIGYAFLNVDFNLVCRKIEKETAISGENNTIVLEGSKVIYVTKDARLHKKIEKESDLLSLISENRDTDGSVRYNCSDFILTGIKDKRTGWEIIKYQPTSFVLRSVIENVGWLLLWCSGLLFLLVVLGYYFSKKLSKNIHTLHEAMCSIDSNSICTISEEGLTNDEIGDLTRAYNQMVKRLNTSIQREYIAKVNEKEMQIRMLQFQINPHFLYNSLNLISSIAELEGYQKIRSILRMLSDMFRYSIKGPNIVRIEDEWRHLLNYISIQSLRFKERFTFHYSMDSDLKECACIKFMLQPVVENCINHGFDVPNYEPGEKHIIKISIQKEAEDILVSIWDNGIGIPEGLLRQINSDLKSGYNATFDSKNSRIGLLNVNSRIKGYFGERYGIEIKSKRGEFTLVLIRLPQKGLDME